MSPWTKAAGAAYRTTSGLHDAWLMRRDDTFRRHAAAIELPGGYRRVYCHHVRKTAGTSLWMSFMALGGEDPMDVWRRITSSRLKRTITGPYPIASLHRRVLAEGAYLFGRSHRPAAAQPLAPGTFEVTVLRDPVRRVHSYYDYLVAGDDPNSPGQVSQGERRLVDQGFDRFLERVPAADLLNQLHMFSARMDVGEAADRIAALPAVFFTEGFADGLADLAERLELPLAVHQARVTGSRSELTEAQVDRLRARLAPEYQLLERLAAAGIVPPTR